MAGIGLKAIAQRLAAAFPNSQQREQLHAILKAGRADAVNVTSATYTASADDGMITLNRAAGITVTLPPATGSGNAYQFFVGTLFTGNGIIQVANASDIMQGQLLVSTDAAGETHVTAATSDTITMNGSTTGGLKGSYIELVDVMANTWQVSGALISSGIEATPFSAAVS